MRYFSFISFNHVYRELNMEAYTLSKLVKFTVCLHFENLLDWIQFCWVVLSSWMFGLLVFTEYNFNYDDHILIVRSSVTLTQLFVIYKSFFSYWKKKNIHFPHIEFKYQYIACYITKVSLNIKNLYIKNIK